MFEICPFAQWQKCWDNALCQIVDMLGICTLSNSRLLVVILADYVLYACDASTSDNHVPITVTVSTCVMSLKGAV